MSTITTGAADLTGALRGPAQPPPSSPEFDPATRAANVDAQKTSSALPLPPFPGSDQTAPGRPWRPRA